MECAHGQAIQSTSLDFATVTAAVVCYCFSNSATETTFADVLRSACIDADAFSTLICLAIAIAPELGGRVAPWLIVVLLRACCVLDASVREGEKTRSSIRSPTTSVHSLLRVEI